MSHSDANELEVQFKPETGKAIVEGKTAVPFQAFITLVLQRKVLSLTKQWGKHPVIVDSELLTSMASAPQDSVENRSNMITVSLIVGALLGIVALAVIEIVLMLANVPLGLKELSILVGSIAVVTVLLMMALKMQRKPKNEKLVETIESLASFLK